VLFETKVRVQSKPIGIGTQGVQKNRNFLTYCTLTYRIGQIRVGRTVLSTQHCLLLPIPLVIVAILSWEKHRELSGGVPAESGRTEVNFYQRNCKWHFGAMAGREKELTFRDWALRGFSAPNENHLFQ
jgi:hypothetical protein